MCHPITKSFEITPGPAWSHFLESLEQIELISDLGHATIFEQCQASRVKGEPEHFAFQNLPSKGIKGKKIETLAREMGAQENIPIGQGFQ